MTRTLIFDTETTDLVSNTLLALDHQPRIVEFYGIVIDENGQDIKELEFLCHPGIPLPEITTRITGLKDEDLAHKKGFAFHADTVRALIEGCDEVAAHNLSYDRFVVDCEFRRLGQPPVKWPHVGTCTVEATEWYNGYRLSLTNLHLHLFGEPFADAHRAKTDVDALKRCFIELRKRGDV